MICTHQKLRHPYYVATHMYDQHLALRLADFFKTVKKASQWAISNGRLQS